MQPQAGLRKSERTYLSTEKLAQIELLSWRRDRPQGNNKFEHWSCKAVSHIQILVASDFIMCFILMYWTHNTRKCKTYTNVLLKFFNGTRDGRHKTHRLLSKISPLKGPFWVKSTPGSILDRDRQVQGSNLDFCYSKTRELGIIPNPSPRQVVSLNGQDLNLNRG